MKENAMNWDAISRRLERAAERVPTTAPDARLDLAVFTADEVETMKEIAGRYPSDALRRGGGLSAFTDDDIDALAVIAERVRAVRDGGEEAAP